MRVSPPIWLASSSPRRRELLAAAGIEFHVLPPDIDDAALRPVRQSPAHWVMSMAHLKARRVAELLQQRDGSAAGTVLAADTVCALGEHIMGQPIDAADAQRMILLLRNTAHQTLTGVCLLDRTTRGRWLWVDAATVFIGPLSDAQIEAYVASGQWRGKAGAYNLEERIQAGWPIVCTGDPATVMGLPMRRLSAWLGGGERATSFAPSASPAALATNSANQSSAESRARLPIPSLAPRSAQQRSAS